MEKNVAKIIGVLLVILGICITPANLYIGIGLAIVRGIIATFVDSKIS